MDYFDNCGKHIEINSNRTSISSNKYHVDTVYGKYTIKAYNNDKPSDRVYLWVLKIDKCWGIHIGIDEDKCSWKNSEFYNKKETANYSISHNGYMHSWKNTNGTKISEKFTHSSIFNAGDTVIMKLDLQQGTLSYYRNQYRNSCCIACHGDILVNEHIKYKLAVCLFGNVRGESSSIVLESFMIKKRRKNGKSSIIAISNNFKEEKMECLPSNNRDNPPNNNHKINKKCVILPLKSRTRSNHILKSPEEVKKILHLGHQKQYNTNPMECDALLDADQRKQLISSELSRKLETWNSTNGNDNSNANPSAKNNKKKLNAIMENDAKAFNAELEETGNSQKQIDALNLKLRDYKKLIFQKGLKLQKSEKTIREQARRISTQKIQLSKRDRDLNGQRLIIDSLDKKIQKMKRRQSLEIKRKKYKIENKMGLDVIESSFKSEIANIQSNHVLNTSDFEKYEIQNVEIMNLCKSFASYLQNYKKSSDDVSSFFKVNNDNCNMNGDDDHKDGLDGGNTNGINKNGSNKENNGDVDVVVVVKVEVNTANYSDWNVKEMVSWINGLEEGRFESQCKQIRNGLIRSQTLKGSLLNALTDDVLKQYPFEIKCIDDRTSLINHFQSLKKQ